ncbi:hypothetical protein BGZ93_011457 [Podila epicladia]|nr:hypothetical protein BGZ93_011457 [Podila epicladia]
MYISGGFNRPQRIVPQTFAIDLSSNWVASSPKAIELSTANSLQDAVVPNTALSNDGRLVVFSNGYSSIFNPTTNQWSNPITISNFNPKDAFHLAAAADPRTGLVYVPSGYVNSTGNTTVTTMLQYDPIKGTSTSLPMTDGPGIVKGYSIIWSDYLKKFVIYGGYIDADPLNILSIYDPASRLWTQPVAIYPPPARVRHCAVPRMAGKKMLVFGGFNDSSWTSNLEDLWELDLVTYEWRRGMNATGFGRGLMVCAVSNNHFISWGGQDKSGIVTKSPTLVYNFNSGAWTSSYQSGSVPPEPKGPNVGVIVAVIVSIVVLLAAAVGLWYWRKRRAQLRKQLEPDATGRPIPGSEVGSGGGGDGGGGGAHGHAWPLSEIAEKPSWAPVNNPQLRYPDNLDYFPPPPPTTTDASARTFSAPGSASAMYNNGVLHDSSIKVEFTQPPLGRSPQEIVPYAQPLDVDISDPQGFVVPNQYRE